MCSKKSLLFVLLGSLIASWSAAANRPLVGAYPEEWPTAENLKSYEALQERHVDIGLIYVDFKTDFKAFKVNADACYNNGTLLLISWMPNGFTCKQIADGVKDDYIRGMARDLKAWGHEVRIRPIYECNGYWFSWGMGKPVNPPAEYVRAFRHIVDLFRAEDVPNVKWEYNINYDNSPGATFLEGYPGDDYVDFMGIDGYNWGTMETWASWKSFRETFDKAYQAFAPFKKPISISEWGCTELGGDKGAWITDAFEQIKNSGDYDLIESVVWFHINKETDWRINSSEGSYEAYKKVVAYKSAPFILDEPRSVSAKPRSAVELSVKIGLPDGATFQWHKDGKPIAGATNPAYKIARVSKKNAGSYTVVIANEAGSVTSAAAKVSLAAKK